MPREVTRATLDRIRVESAVSDDPDPAVAVRDLASALGTDAGLYLVFVTVPYALDGLARELTARWGERVIGCTCTRFFGPTATERGGVMAVSLTGDLSAETIPILPLDDMTAGLVRADAQLARVRLATHDAPEGTGAFALLLIDGLSLAEEHLAAALIGGLDGIPVVGGSASDDMRFERTAVLLGGRFVDNAATCTVVRTAAPFTPFRFQHYEPRDEILVITRATPRERLVHEINGVPAAQAYASAIGVEAAALTPEIIAAHPVVLRGGGASWVRSVLKVHPDGTLGFFAAIDAGAVLRLARPTNPVQVLREGFAGVRRQIGDLQGVLAFDCILRHAEFQRTGVSRQIAEELARHDVAGFSTYGEQCEGMHVNQTMVGVAFGAGCRDVPAPPSGTPR